MGWDVRMGLGLGVTANKSKVVGGRITMNWKRVGLNGGEIVKLYLQKEWKIKLETGGIERWRNRQIIPPKKVED